MPCNILIADDERAMLKLYARIFSGSGYSITMASSFSEAVRLIKKNDYDLLVTDLIFPDGVGTELVRLFEKKKADAKSFVVTGSAPIESLPEFSDNAKYFEKPFKIDMFMDAVEKALGN